MSHQSWITRRSAALLALFSAAVVVLAGCAKMEMDITINENGTFDASIVAAYSDAALEQLAQATGMTAAEIMAEADADALASEFTGVFEGEGTSTPYAQGGYTGTRVVMTGQPLSDLTGTDLSIDLVDNQYVLRGLMDLSTADFDFGNLQSEIAALSPEVASSMGDMQVTISFTFPGAVVSTNGQANGNTAYWNLTIGQVNTIEATAWAGASDPPETLTPTATAQPTDQPTDEPTKSARTERPKKTTNAANPAAKSSGMSTPLLIGLIAGGVLLIAIVALIIALARRSSKAKAAASPDQPAYSPPGVASAAGQPYGAPPVAPYGQPPVAPGEAPTQQFQPPAAEQFPPPPSAAPYGQPPAAPGEVPPTQQFPPPPPAAPYGQPPAAPGEVPPTQQFPPPPPPGS